MKARGSTNLSKQCPQEYSQQNATKDPPEYPQVLDLPQQHTISRRDIQLPRWAFAMPLKNISRHAAILEQHRHMVPPVIIFSS